VPFLYHQVKKPVREDRLFALNRLKIRQPDLYELEMKKYANRKWLSSRSIPLLKCNWHDAIQLTPVLPKTISDALGRLGTAFSGEWLEIPSKMIDPDKTVIFLYSHDVYTNAPFDEAEFIPFTVTDVARYGFLPPTTLEHYRECVLAGKAPRLYYRTAHVLTTQEIPVKGLGRVIV